VALAPAAFAAQPHDLSPSMILTTIKIGHLCGSKTFQPGAVDDDMH
jgi:hypothetical protein